MRKSNTMKSCKRSVPAAQAHLLRVQSLGFQPAIWHYACVDFTQGSKLALSRTKGEASISEMPSVQLNPMLNFSVPSSRRLHCEICNVVYKVKQAWWFIFENIILKCQTLFVSANIVISKVNLK